jgi:hypothetical protein
MAVIGGWSKSKDCGGKAEEEARAKAEADSLRE